MSEFFQKLFSSEFMPHGHCYFWRADILWLNVVSDALITLSYYSLPVLLILLVKRRRDLVYNWMFGLFAAFIFLCGTTHVFDILTVWHPIYGAQGIVKLLTGIVSFCTAIMLWRIMPQILALPSSTALRSEVEYRKKMQASLELNTSELEERVRIRTKELALMNTSLKRLAAMVDAATVAIFAISTEGILLTWNKGAEALFQLDAKQVLNGRWSFVRDILKLDALDSCLSQLRQGVSVNDLVIEVARQNGAKQEIVFSLSMASRNDSSDGTILIVARDITERRKHEKMFREIVRAAPESILVVKPDGKILFGNEQAERLFGYSSDEFFNMDVEMLIPECVRAEHLSFGRDYLNNPELKPMGKGREIQGLRKDGTLVALEVGLAPVETLEGPLIVTSLIDISDRKQSEERLKASLDEKELLLREVHHRVKNNLQVVSSLLKLQANILPESEERKSLLESDNRVRSIALVHEKLYRSQTLSKVDFKSYLEDLTRSLISAHGVDGKVIELTLDIQQVELTIERAIPCGLIVNELVSNSIKHAFKQVESGKICIKFFEEEGKLVLIVQDTGTGLPENFDLKAPRTLGLKVVSTLATQLGATLVVRREGGTTVEVSFVNAPGARAKKR